MLEGIVLPSVCMVLGTERYGKEKVVCRGLDQDYEFKREKWKHEELGASEPDYSKVVWIQGWGPESGVDLGGDKLK